MTELHAEAADSGAQSADAASGNAHPEAQPAESVQAANVVGNPAVLGLMVFATGSLVLGISLLGNVPLAVQPGTVQPIVFAGTGLLLLVTTIWAASLQQTFVATILGTFAGFWFSYSAMVLGLTHNWYAIPAANVSSTLGQFLIGWDVAIFMLFLVTLRLPLVYSGILGAGTIGVAFLAAAVLGTSSVTYRIGGVFVLIFATLGYYAYLSGALESVGGKGLPLGKPVVSMLSK
jgi:succinate-acetate transporter protein